MCIKITSEKTTKTVTLPIDYQLIKNEFERKISSPKINEEPFFAVALSNPKWFNFPSKARFPSQEDLQD